MKLAPCRDCEKRCVGCHSDCEEYGEYKANIKDNNDKRYAYWQQEKAFRSVLSRATKSRLYGGC